MGCGGSTANGAGGGKAGIADGKAGELAAGIAVVPDGSRGSPRVGQGANGSGVPAASSSASGVSPTKQHQLSAQPSTDGSTPMATPVEAYSTSSLSGKGATRIALSGAAAKAKSAAGTAGAGGTAATAVKTAVSGSSAAAASAPGTGSVGKSGLVLQLKMPGAKGIQPAGAAPGGGVPPKAPTAAGNSAGPKAPGVVTIVKPAPSVVQLPLSPKSAAAIAAGPASPSSGPRVLSNAASATSVSAVAQSTVLKTPSSSQLPHAPGAHATAAGGGGTHGRAASVTDSLGGLSEEKVAVSAPRTPPDPKSASVLSHLLLCRNCEEVGQPPAILCPECAHTNDDAPPVFCLGCSADLHNSTKTRGHPRQTLSAWAGSGAKPPRTAGELGLGGPHIPSTLLLFALPCDNCNSEEVEATTYCTQCKLLLCAECARDLHAGAKTRAHVRISPLRCRFIHAGVKEASKDAEKQIASDALKRAASLAAQSVAKPVSASAAAAGISAPMPLTSMANVASFALAALANKKSAGGMGQTFMPPSRSPSPDIVSKRAPSSKLRKAPNEDGMPDATPTMNAGVSGDLYAFADPSLSEAQLNEVQLELRNVLNPYDIGRCQVVCIAVGSDHAAAVTAQGTLFTWGDNSSGQLGCGLNALSGEKFSREPVVVPFPRHRPIRQAACGYTHSLALAADGSVWSWGQGLMGRLGLYGPSGRPSDEDHDTPARVLLGHWGPRGEDEPVDNSGDERVVLVACGANNSGCIVKGRKDKFQLYLWGGGESGQIPTSDPSLPESAKLMPRLYPQLVQVGADAKSDPCPPLKGLSFGTRHVVALTEEGRVYTWGETSFGQCGYHMQANAAAADLGLDDNRTLQLMPRLVPKLAVDGVRVVQVCAGERHTTCLSDKGDVYSFGAGESHQLGVLDNDDVFEPVRADGVGVECGKPVTHISVGQSITSAVTAAGETFLCGWGVESAIFQKVAGLAGRVAQAVGVGKNNNIVLHTGVANDLYEWQFDGAALDAEETHGGDLDGHDDGGSGGGKGAPQVNKHLRGKRVATLACGKAHFFAVTGEGRVYAWGSNHLNETGLKLSANVTFVPAPLELKFGAADASGGGAVAIREIKAAVEHTLAVAVDGSVYSWGVQFEGRLGHGLGMPGDCPQPRRIESLVAQQMKVRTVAVGPSNSAAVGVNGEVFVWGSSHEGQCGTGDVLPQFGPARVQGALLKERVVQIALGNAHAVALSASSNQVFTWGSNKFLQLGLWPAFQDERSELPQPVDVLRTLGVEPVEVEAGDNVCVVLGRDGCLYGWGSGETQQIVHPPSADADDGNGGGGEDVGAPIKLWLPFQQGDNPRRVTALSVRDINCACVVDDHSVWVWGWDLSRDGQPARVRVAKPQASAASAGASCASSGPGGGGDGDLIEYDSIALGHTRLLLLSR